MCLILEVSSDLKVLAPSSVLERTLVASVLRRRGPAVPRRGGLCQVFLNHCPEMHYSLQLPKIHIGAHQNSSDVGSRGRCHQRTASLASQVSLSLLLFISESHCVTRSIGLGLWDTRIVVLVLILTNEVT